MWGAFAKFMEGLVTGDRAKVEEALSTSPGEKCQACADKTHKEGDAPCAARADDGFRCVAHGADGACVMGKAA